MHSTKYEATKHLKIYVRIVIVNTILYKKYKKLFKIMQKLGANMYFFISLRYLWIKAQHISSLV